VANIKSQIKRNRQNEKRRLRNKSVKSALKTSVRKFNEAAATGDVEQARQGREQGRHPQEPGGEPQVGHRQATVVALRLIARRGPASVATPPGQWPGGVFAYRFRYKSGETALIRRRGAVPGVACFTLDVG
jgi:small subunit ribosomal protein S20